MFLPNGQRATFIQGGMFIPDSRVRTYYYYLHDALFFLSKNLLFKMRIEQIAYSYIFLNFYERGTFEVDFIVSDYIPFREVLPKTLF